MLASTQLEEAIEAVAESSQDHSTPDFGTNQWLVEEMYDRFKTDPSSVDDTWAAFFNSGDGASLNGSAGSENGASAPAPVATTPKTPLTSPESDVKPAAKTQPATSRPPEEKQADSPAPVAPVPATPPPPPAKPTAKKAEPTDAPTGPGEVQKVVLRGAAARTVQNMDASLTVPTATSVRSVPVKLLFDNRTVINNHLARARGGKVSFTHLIGYAIVQAVKAMPEMNTGYEVDEKGKPNQLKPEHINFGLAIDLQKPDGSRQLLVPSIKATETMSFAQFWAAYETMVRKARDGKLEVSDFQGTTLSLTNPGGIGTNHSVPRLMAGQGVIIGVGSMEYPPEFQGASEHTLAQMAISKMVTLTSTYDHRVILGALSGEFLRRMHGLLLGEEGFYDEIFRSLRIPYEPIRWSSDISTNHDDEISKQARILELIHAYRVRGHMMADTDPLEYKQRSHPDLEVESHGLTLWDLD
ncbi:MAG: kgd, partial [Aeromicrobium sp.]|nr:kgd [Aeromicrobium sp.]